MVSDMEERKEIAVTWSTSSPHLHQSFDRSILHWHHVQFISMQKFELTSLKPVCLLLKQELNCSERGLITLDKMTEFTT